MNMVGVNSISKIISEISISFFQIESCLPPHEIIADYTSLLDGRILHTVYLQIDPEPQYYPVKLLDTEISSSTTARSRNFDSLVRNLRKLYEEEFGQTLLALPDCSILGQFPESQAGLEQLQLLITLLLGAAVQCPNKELFIARIKELDLDTQYAIVKLIKQVTDSHTLVLRQDAQDQLPSDAMFKHVVRLAKERDQYHNRWMSAVIDTDAKTNLHESCLATPNSVNTPSKSSGNSQLATELADTRSKLRKLRQELEEKSELLMEVKEELDHKNIQYEKLRIESQDWYSEAKRAAAYRDEVDVLRERSERVDRLEVEVQKLRERLSDAEFYRTRVEELKEDNRMLLETKDMLEEQLQYSRKRSGQVVVLETEIIKLKQMLHDVSLERDVDKNKLQDLLKENAQLQLTTKNLLAGPDANQRQEDDVPSNESSLSEQLTTKAQSRALKLELENRRLLAELNSHKESSSHETSNRIMELEKDKKKLSLRLDQMQEKCNRYLQQNSELENVFKNALEENKKLHDALDAKQQVLDKQGHDRELDRIRQADLEKQIENLSKDKQRLQNLCESIQRRAVDLERAVERKTKEVRQLNERCVELNNIKKEFCELNTKTASLEQENTTQAKDLVKYKEMLEQKDIELDKTCAKLNQNENEIGQLMKQLEESDTIKKQFQDMKKLNKELLSQQKIKDATISTLQKNLHNETLASKRIKQNLKNLGLNESDMENSDINLKVIVDKLCEDSNSFKTVREVVLDVGKEIMKSADVCVFCHKQRIYTVEKDIEYSDNNNEATRVTDLELQLDQLKVEHSDLQLANKSLQAENIQQKAKVETLGSQITSLNTQQTALQLTNSQLAAEKDTLVKQMETKNQVYESLQHDQETLRHLNEQLTKQYDSVNNEKEILKTAYRLLRTENRELKEQVLMLQKQLEECKLELASMKDDITNLKAEHSELEEDFQRLFTNNELLKQEFKNRQEQYRDCKMENSRLKLDNTEQSSELSKKVERITNLENENTRLHQQCEILLQANSSLDTDRRTLMDQVSQLFAQYHELLAHSLEDKQHYHAEEKNFTDRMNYLHRHKEKLEEKIMEHYRNMDSYSPKRKPFGLNFVKKVRKAGSELMNRVPNRNRRTCADEQRQTQSESGGNESDNSAEEPTHTGNDALNVGTAGSRRTVYVVEEKANKDNGGT
ncbi:girdin-like [Topomyia yanbarensis]|uniref:girdin-like n=1 Tax=Topomyia yanbarensis TaxID=2498891 RepID=UPI00273C6223|nr:girdin-like [Topomyia yanbarensis]